MIRKRSIAALLLATAASAYASEVAVAVEPFGGNRYQIRLEAGINAPQAAVWKVLTDYNHHAGLLPYMSKSQIISPSPLTVEQEGKIRVMFWTFTMHVTQQVTETPPSVMKFHAIAGDFKQLEGVWRLASSGADTQLRCQFLVEPKRQVPAWAVRFTAKRYLAKMVHVLGEHATK